MKLFTPAAEKKTNSSPTTSGGEATESLNQQSFVEVGVQTALFGPFDSDFDESVLIKLEDYTVDGFYHKLLSGNGE